MTEPEKKETRQVPLNHSQVLDLTSATEANHGTDQGNDGISNVSSQDVLPLASKKDRADTRLEDSKNKPQEINSEVMTEAGDSDVKDGPPQTELNTSQNRRFAQPGAVWVDGIQAQRQSIEVEQDDTIEDCEGQQHVPQTVLSPIHPDELHQEVLDNMPKATVTSATSKSSHRAIYFAIAGLFIITVGAVATLVLLFRDGNSATTEPGDELLSMLIRRSQDLYEGDLNATTFPLLNQSSGQYQAFKWLRGRTEIILNNDALAQTSKRDLSNPSVREDWLVHNYVLRLLYESMGGENWVSESASPFNWFESPTLDYCTYGMERAFAPNFAGFEVYEPCDESLAGKLTLLSLVRLGLKGSIPVEIGLLADLEYFGMQVNTVTGSLPRSLGRLSRLQVIDLAFNDITGTLPSELGSLTSLIDFLIHENPNLTGELPKEYESMKSLRTLTMHGTDLGGSVSDSICESWDATDELHAGSVSFTASCERLNCSCCTQCFLT